jgi:pyruvate kinase
LFSPLSFEGPKIRTGKIAEPFTLTVGDKIRVTPEKIIGDRNRIQIQYATMLQDLEVGDVIFVNDGVNTIGFFFFFCSSFDEILPQLIKLSVIGKEAKDLVCETQAGGTISSHKGCNIPSGKNSLDVLTDKDREDLQLIAKLNPEWVAASFIGTGEDVQKVRDYLKSCGGNDIKVISKIERPVALQNIDQIIKLSDAVMVARGDLGVEIPAWDVPAAQKMIIRKCNAQGCPVIVATQVNSFKL